MGPVIYVLSSAMFSCEGAGAECVGVGVGWEWGGGGWGGGTKRGGDDLENKMLMGDAARPGSTSGSYPKAPAVVKAFS